MACRCRVQVCVGQRRIIDEGNVLTGFVGYKSVISKASILLLLLAEGGLRGVRAQEKDFCFQPGLSDGYCLWVVGFGLSVVSGGVAVVCCWLSAVVFRLLTVDSRVSLSKVVVGSWLSSVGCRVLIVDCLCRLSHRFLGFSIVGAQLCVSDNVMSDQNC